MEGQFLATQSSDKLEKNILDEEMGWGGVSKRLILYVLRSKCGANQWRCRKVEKQFGIGFGERRKLEK